MAPQQLDLVFAVDCTGSMGSYIKSAQRNICQISEDILATESRDLQFGLVEYRDHPPQDSTFVTRVHKLHSSLRKMKTKVDAMNASGGGDGPESVADALHEALHMPWRKDAVKVVVLISDAPPHGLGESGDGFPDGCPLGHDPVAIAQEMATQGIIVYSVGCEPAIGSYQRARAFLKGIADVTEGKYVSLGNAHLLPKVIVGGANEEFDLAALEEAAEAERAEIVANNADLNEDQVESQVTENLQRKGHRSHFVELDMQDNDPASAVFMEAKSLKEARGKVMDMPVYQPAESFNYAQQSCVLKEETVSRSVIAKVMKRKSKKAY